MAGRVLIYYVANYIVFNPLRMRKRVTVVCPYVCMSVSLSVNALTARALISAILTWYYQKRLVDFAKMALFKSYAVIYLAIGTVICEILFVFYSCANDDTEMATFDHPIILLAITVVRAQLWWQDPSKRS